MFSQDIADTICQQLAEGKSLRAACDADGMPHPATILRWAQTEPFAQQYARARETGYQLMADDIIDISDETSLDTVKDKDGNEKPDSEWISRSRLRVDSRKWLLSKMLPKVYGDKLDVEHKGNVSVKLEAGDGGIL